jgi:hypothetical protein
MLYHIFARWFLRTLVVGSICLGLGIMAGPLPASAATGGCRADPKVWLSNGMKLTMTIDLTADASLVKTVTYTVHAPRGLSVDRIVYTGGALQAKERVVLVFDRQSGYVIETRADLGGTVAAMTANAAAANDKRALTGSSASPLVFQFP